MRIPSLEQIRRLEKTIHMTLDPYSFVYIIKPSVAVEHRGQMVVYPTLHSNS